MLVHLPRVADSRAPVATHSVNGNLSRATEGIGVTDPDGLLVYLDEFHARVFGRTDARQMLGRHWRAVYRSEQAAFIEGLVLPELCVTGHWSGRIELRRAIGSPGSFRAAFEKLPNGYILCRSISEGDADEQFLHLIESDHLHRETLRRAPLPVAIKDADQRFTFVNDAALELWHWSRAKVIGRTMREIDATRAAEMESAEREVLDHGQPAHRDGVIETSSGPRHVRAVTTRVDSPEGGPERCHLVTVWLDLTAERTTAEQKQAALERHHHYLLMQREFISLVSHEFRTPLATMQGAIYLLQSDLAQEPDDKRQRWLNLMRDAMATLRELADQVLELNRMDAVVPSAVAAPGVVLAQFLTAFVQLQAEYFGPSRVVFEIARDVPLTVRVSSSLLRAVLDNLVSNALKYSESTSVVRVRAGMMGGRVRLTVCNRGRGVAPAEVPKLWEPFFRGSNTTGIAGTGLGLTIVKRAAELMNASVGCASVPGEETEFWVEFLP